MRTPPPEAAPGDPVEVAGSNRPSSPRKGAGTGAPIDSEALAPAASRPPGLAHTLVRNERWLVLVMLVLGVALRVTPILWGSVHFNPDQAGFHPDEPKLVRPLDDFPGSLTEYHDYRYPSFLPFAYGALWVPIGEALDLRDPAPSAPGTPSYEAALLFGRALNVLLFGLGGLLLIWGFTRFSFGPGPALLALAAANCLGRPLTSTALVLPDVAAALLLFASFYLLARAERRGLLTSRAMVPIGAVLGLAVASKYTAAVGAVGIAGVLGFTWHAKHLDGRRAIRLVAVAGVSTLAAFVLFVPGVLYDTERFLGSLTFEFRNKLQSEGSTLDSLVPGFLRNYPVPILLAAVSGLFFAPRLRRALGRPRSAVLPAAGLSLVLFLLVSLRSFRADYAIMFFPFVALSAGVGLWGLLRLPLRGVGSAVVVGVLLVGTLQSARWVILRYTGDPNYRIDAWIKENLPPGPIGVAPWPTFRPNGPKAPEGYHFVKVHELPEQIIVFGRNRDGALDFLEDPERTRRQMIKRWGVKRTESHYSAVPGERRFGMLLERDFRFYEDVFLGLRRRWNYELLVEFDVVESPLDLPGFWVGIYERVGTPPE